MTQIPLWAFIIATSPVFLAVMIVAVLTGLLLDLAGLFLGIWGATAMALDSSV
jgi:hypothetical protein